jgi:hypothetical protein
MAARRHWRFTVRDQFGYVIQNARVFVYQPGTTTDFTGTCYNAASGGSPITNPFTSNSQGEVEGWFDTAQVVDVLVTSNSGTAYRAAFPTVLAPFTSFTEKDDIYASASDTPLEKGTTSDLADITAAAQSEVLGTSNRWADGAHVHGHTAFSNNPHGSGEHSQTLSTNPHSHGDHTDSTRTFYLPAAIGTPQVGALASLGTYPNILRVTTLADAVNTNGMFWHFNTPNEWASGALSFQPIWVPGSTDGVAHTVRWQYDIKELVSATDVTAAGTTTTWTGASAARTANLLAIDSITSAGLTPSAADTLIRFAVTRLGSDGADTYVGVVNLAGVLVYYTASN